MHSFADEEQYKHAFLGAPFGMLIVNSDGIIESANKQAGMIFDYKQEQLIGKNVDSLVPKRLKQAHQTHRDRYNQNMEKKLMGNGRYLYGLKRDGKELPIEIGLNPIEHSSGVKIIVSITDISKLVTAQEQLIEQHERAVVTLSSIGDGVITTDNNGIIESINSKGEKMTGWSSSEAIGQHISDVFKIINEKTGESYETAIVDCLNHETIIQPRLETLLISKKGLNTPIQESAAPIHNAHGTIIGAVLVFHDVTQMRNYAHEIEYHANHDILTGLLNRREFDARLNNTIKREAEKNHANVLLYLDIDRFKVINDTAGHIAGDELLKQVSEIILDKLRSRDTFSRLGGDEFAILLEHCSLDTGQKIATNICREVGNFSFFWNKQMFSVSVSIGLICFQSDSTADALLSKADAACYMAKKNGRNRVQVYDDLAAKKHDETHIVNMLTHAFEQDLMVLYQQKIQAVNQSDTHQHCEILVRMLGDNNEIIPPDVFLPAAERYGLATTLDRWVIRQVFKWLTEHNEKLSTPFTMSINLSAQSITDELFGEFVREQFMIYQINPENICFEITETSATYDLVKAVSFIDDLKKAGCQFSLDDFGSGHAAYAQLKHLPVDYLKIDGSLVRDILKDQIDYSIVRSVNEVGQVLGMKTIAEYVENNKIVEKLTEIGVDYLQGYEIARPTPLDDLLSN